MNISDHFFVIDSEHLNEVTSKFYGYTIQNNTLIVSTEFLETIPPMGDGAYVYIQRTPDKIILHQDFVGSFGLYLYRENNYFALSNSFMYLVDYVKRNHTISMNLDYANLLITSPLCSVAYSATMINEITLLDRSAVIEIDISEKNLNCSFHDYEENTVELCSEKGMQILDNWYYKWTDYIRNLKVQTDNIQFDLSGGFDTRLIFTLLLGSGIDLNEIFIHSIDDQLYTHASDYEIASLISEYYHFSLNDRSHLSTDVTPNTLEDILNISFLTKLGFHKQMYFRFNHFETKRHFFSGSGGECIRSYWNSSEEEFTRDYLKRCKKISPANCEKFQKSTCTMLAASFQGIQAKFQKWGRSIAPKDMTLNLYRETRCRNHFGKDTVENHCSNSIKYSPLLDPELHRLRLVDEHCDDKNLLMAVIFERYQPDLLNFPFQGDRMIAASTLEYAKQMNAKYPFECKTEKVVSENVKVSVPENHVLPNANLVRLSNEEVTGFIKKAIYSENLKTYFNLLYDEELYDFILRDINKRQYHSLAYAYVVIAISKITQDVLANPVMQNDSIADFLERSVQDSESENHPCFIQDKINNLQQMLELQNQKIQELEQMKDAIINSSTYKAGRIMMWLPRWIKEWIYKVFAAKKE